jgi:hypothetical protein
VVKIEVNPARIERVTIEAKYEVERELDTATFVLLQPHLRRINQELKRQAQKFLRGNTDRQAAGGLSSLSE